MLEVEKSVYFHGIECIVGGNIALDHTTLHNIIFKEEADAQLDIEHRPVGADTYFASQLQCW